MSKQIKMKDLLHEVFEDTPKENKHEVMLMFDLIFAS